MADTQTCPQCGTEVDSRGFSGQLCPACLLKLGLEEEGKDRIGPYEIQELLGEGGMGLVYLAEQQSPLRRQVALKVIKAGMDSREVIARFESERQALALMKHPNIARVFEAGATQQGRPYFAMEYVRGIPITEYCDSNRLDTRSRLQLFHQVCQAIQHAHQKGIIHRDIKPSNLLVEEQDGQPIPKVIDFGIAKATQQRLSEKTFLTQQGAVIGTPDYMSPEQGELSAAQADARSDIYSLGVLLYELLTGVLPFAPASLREGGLDEMRRILREEDPPTPSIRLKHLRQTSRQIAQSRRTDPSTLEKLLEGDLDWITMKAMEKDPERRYASASELAADLIRHLEHQPVLAGPPGARYLAGKFMRRHRLGVAAVAALTVALLAGIAGTSLGMLRAVQAEKKAIQEAQTAQQVSDFLVDLFALSDPGEAQGNTVTVRQALDQGAEKIGQELSQQPLVQARLMDTIGRVYQNLGLYDQARPVLEEALKIRQQSVGSGDLLVAESMNRLAGLLWLSGQYQAALPLFQGAVEIREEVLGPDHPQLAESLRNLGIHYYQMSDYPAAGKLFERSLQIREAALGPNHLDVASSLNALAILLWKTGDYQTAKQHYQRALRIRQEFLPPEHPEVQSIMSNLAVLLKDLGEYVQARRHHLQILEIRQKVLGPHHPEVAAALNNLANIDWHRGDYQAALPLYRRALEIREKTLQEGHADLAISRENLALAMWKCGDPQGALPLLNQVLQMRRQALGGDHPDVAHSLDHLATVWREVGELQNAEQLFRQALQIRKDKLGPQHPFYAESLSNLAGLLIQTERRPQAGPLLEQALQIQEERLGCNHPKLVGTLENLAEFYRKSGQPERALEFAERARLIREQKESRQGAQAPN